MFAPISFTKGYKEITSKPYGILKGVVDAHAFVRGTWGREIVDSLSPGSEDIIIDGKRGLDTFASTNLDFILRSRGMKTLVIAGFLTNCCVESTVCTGYEKGFSMIAQRHSQRRNRGATVQGSYMVRGSNPDDNTIMMAPGHETGFGFFTNVTIDQHVDVRRRQYDLAAVIKLHPDLLGLGLD